MRNHPVIRVVKRDAGGNKQIPRILLLVLASIKNRTELQNKAVLGKSGLNWAQHAATTRRRGKLVRRKKGNRVEAV